MAVVRLRYQCNVFVDVDVTTGEVTDVVVSEASAQPVALAGSATWDADAQDGNHLFERASELADEALWPQWRFGEF